MARLYFNKYFRKKRKKKPYGKGKDPPYSDSLGRQEDNAGELGLLN